MGILNLPAINQARDSFGQPVPRARRYVYAAGTDTLCPIFEDPGLTNQQANPMLADETGTFSLCHLMDGNYRVELRDTGGKLLHAEDGLRIRSPLVSGIAVSMSSFSHLLEDSVLSYDESKKSHSVAAGDVIHVLDGNAHYRVAAPDAADHHTATTGGVKLYLIPSTKIDIRAFGISGGRDETENLESFRRYAVANPGTLFDFTRIPNKELQYRTPKWLAGVQDATVDLTGISLRNLGVGTFGYSDMDGALLIGSGPYFHDNQNTGQIDPAHAHSGHLIGDAAAGNISVTLLDGADAVAYAPGDRVLLRWLERQGAASFPPNPGFFEWLTVADVSDAAITFTTPLRHSYRAQAPDYTSGAYYDVCNGRARILNLTRTGYITSGRLRIIGGSGVSTGDAPNAAYDGALVIEGAQHVEMIGGRFHSIWIGCCETVVLRKCDIRGTVGEFDKIVGEIVAENCLLDSVQQGSGVERFKMTGGALTGNVQLRMKTICLDGVTVATDAAPGDVMLSMDQYPRDLVEVRNCRFTPTGTATSAIQTGNLVSFVPDAINQTEILVAAGNAALPDIVRNLDRGQVITLNDGTPPEHFFVTDFRFDGSDNLVIEGYCEVSAPSAGLRNLWLAKKLVWQNNAVVNPPVGFRPLMAGRRVWHQDTGKDGEVYITRVLRHAEYGTLSVNCYVDRVDIDVIKSYSGADTVCSLGIAAQGAGAPQHFADVNVKAAGRRVSALSGTSGSLAGDILTIPPTRTWIEDLVLHLYGDPGNGVISDSAVQALPLIRVTIRGYKPPFDESGC